jgi:hypothetical protein
LVRNEKILKKKKKKKERKRLLGVSKEKPPYIDNVSS